jgi:hypothetical protein
VEVVVLDIGYKQKFRVAVAIFTLIMIFLLAGTVFMGSRLVKNRK